MNMLLEAAVRFIPDYAGNLAGLSGFPLKLFTPDAAGGGAFPVQFHVTVTSLATVSDDGS